MEREQIQVQQFFINVAPDLWPCSRVQKACPLPEAPAPIAPPPDGYEQLSTFSLTQTQEGPFPLVNPRRDTIYSLSEF